jgi:hypothetical protein
MNPASKDDRRLTILGSRSVDTRCGARGPTSKSPAFLLAGITTAVIAVLIAVFAGLHLGAPGGNSSAQSGIHPVEVIAMPACSDGH